MTLMVCSKASPGSTEKTGIVVHQEQSNFSSIHFFILSMEYDSIALIIFCFCYGTIARGTVQISCGNVPTFFKKSVKIFDACNMNLRLVRKISHAIFANEGKFVKSKEPHVNHIFLQESIMTKEVFKYIHLPRFVHAKIFFGSPSSSLSKAISNPRSNFFVVS